LWDTGSTFDNEFRRKKSTAMLKGAIIGFVLAVIIFGGGLYYYFATGMAPIAATDPPMPFERMLSHLALEAHIEKQATGQSPVAADETAYLGGARVYKQHCAMCHGLAGQPPTEYETTMFPNPPQLFRGKGVTDDPVSETYWKTANGIRLTGMPAFKTKLTEAQVWQVSQLLVHANEIPDSVKKVLVSDVALSMPAPALTPASSPNPTVK
jgi:thiosulfate dehydrogenase